MLKIKRCGVFFVIILIFKSGFCAQREVLDLEPIIISKSKVHLLDTYSLNQDDLKDLAFTTPVEALSHLPLDLQSRSLKAGIQTDFSLRGSTFQEVLILIDGSRINDPQTAHHNSDIPLTLEDIERIEVVPGVSSSIFGPDALGGAINFIRKKPKEKKKVLEFSMGEHKLKSGIFSITEKLNNLGLRLSLENQESGGFYLDTDFKKFTANLSSTLDISDGEFNINWGYQEKEFGAYDFYTPASGYQSKEWTKTYLLDTGLNLEKKGLLIKLNFLWRRHFDKYLLDKTLIRSRYLNHHRSDIYTPNIYLQSQIGFLGRVGLGLEYGEEKINSTNLGKHNRKHKSIFLDETKDLSDKSSLGLSWRRDDFSSFGEIYTGSLSIRHRISQENFIYLGVSRSMRIPSFTELYYNDPTTLGNAGLSAEKSINYQAGYEYKKENLSCGITLFFREEKDLIDWVKRSTNQAKWQVENITEDEVKGIESYLRLKINRYIDLDSNYSYIDKRVNDQGYLYKYGQNYIKHLINGLFTFHLPFGDQAIGFTYKKKPARDGWFLLNTSFSYQFTKISQLFLKITNLLNVEYQEIQGIPQPGRWLEAGLRFEW